MISLLKVFGRGILVTVLLPVILLVLASYGVYCLVLFVVMFFKGVVDFFKGKDFSADMVEDLEAKRILLEKEKADEQAKEMLNIMYQNAMAQVQLDTPPTPSQENTQPSEPIPFGPEMFASEEETEEPSLEETEENEDVSNG